MDINYIILAHKNPAQVERLITKLSTDSTNFYTHIDRNAAIEPFKRQLTAAKNNCFVEPREKGTWGDLGIVKAIIWALQQIIADQRQGYCVLLSGQDYPIKSNQEIARYLTLNQGASFVEAFPLPSPNWNHGGADRIAYYKFNLSEAREDYMVVPPLFSKDFSIHRAYYLHNISKLLRRRIIPWTILKKRRFPAYIKPHGGSQWWAIPVETAEKILTFLHQNPDYLPYHQYTLLPDEIAFQSLLSYLHSEDASAIQEPVTYVNWERPGVALPVTFEEGDLQELLQQPESKLFARKFDSDIDATILDLLDRLT